MSVALYDKALIDKIKAWTNNTDMQIYGPSDTAAVFQQQADINDDKPVKLPLIVIRRNGGFEITNPNKQPLSYDGATQHASIEKSVQLNAIPISLSYQVDIYTRYFEEADEYARNFVFNLINYPKVTVQIPYNGSWILHDSAIRLNTTVEDNSDVPERIVKGQFTRMTLSFTISDAYIWDVRVRDNYKIDFEVDLVKPMGD